MCSVDLILILHYRLQDAAAAFVVVVLFCKVQSFVFFKLLERIFLFDFKCLAIGLFGCTVGTPVLNIGCFTFCAQVVLIFLEILIQLFCSLLSCVSVFFSYLYASAAEIPLDLYLTRARFLELRFANEKF